jgi:hypothetical protein
MLRRPVCLCVKHLPGAQDQVLITVIQLRAWYGASYLASGRICRLQLLLAVARAVILESESREAHDHILLPQIRDSPKLEGQVPVFTASRNSVYQLFPQALGSLFVASYDLQDYGGGIRTCIHAGTALGMTELF